MDVPCIFKLKFGSQFLLYVQTCVTLTFSVNKLKLSSCLRYDWSIITKVAEDHLLDRVIGGQMGCEYVDMFSSLLSRNMRSILTNILSLLGDMDLIR